MSAHISNVDLTQDGNGHPVNSQVRVPTMMSVHIHVSLVREENRYFVRQHVSVLALSVQTGKHALSHACNTPHTH